MFSPVTGKAGHMAWFIITLVGKYLFFHGEDANGREKEWLLTL